MSSITQHTPSSKQTSTAASRSAAQTQSSATGTNSPAPGRSSVAPSSKTSLTPHASEPSDMSAAVGGPLTAHGRSDSVNGRNPTIPAIPTVGGPTIMNGGNTFVPNDHNRKPSMTVTPAGVTGFATNGNTPGGAQGKAGIQFGSMNAGSPAMGTPSLANQSATNLTVASLNPRAASPQGSPSPIPQPAIATGGRLPTTYQNQGNGLSSIQFGGDTSDPNGIMRPQMPLGPQQDHIRRGSTQSIQSDMGGNNMPTGPNRGGFGSGRGRGAYPQASFQPQAYSHSPNPNYRPNQPGRGNNMYNNYGQGRGAPYQGSPSLAARTPMVPNVNPGTPQMQPMPMVQQGGQGQQQYGGYHMGPQPVNRHSSIPRENSARGKLRGQHGNSRGQRTGQSYRGSGRDGFRDGPGSRIDPALDIYQPRPLPQPQPQPHTPFFPIPTDISPESGQFENFLTHVNQGFPMQSDPSIQNMYTQNQWLMGQQMQGQYQPPYMAPPSPRPPYQQGPHAPYMQHTYSGQGQPPSMSRQSSQMSMPDRPTSSIGQAQSQTPSMTTATTPAHNNNRSTSISTQKSNFQLPQKKSAALVIKNAQGEVVNFSKAAASPAPPTPSSTTPSIPLAPTPPSRSASTNEAAHGRTDSVSVKTADEKKREMQEAVTKKLQEEAAKAKQEQEEAEQKALKEKEEEEETVEVHAATADEDSDEVHEEVRETQKASEEIDAETLAEPKEDQVPTPEASAAPSTKDDDEPDYDAIEAEFAAQEEEEARKEAEYQAKKAAAREAQRKKEEEEEAEYEITLKEQERAAEEREKMLEKKRAEGGSDDEVTKKMFASLKLHDAPTPTSIESPDVQTPIESGTNTPNSESSMPPPARTSGAAKRGKVADLTLITSKTIEPPEPSATLKSLKSARLLEDPTKIEYPSGIVSPNPALNANAPADRKFKYNKEFLLQFQDVFREKPSLDWDAKIRETIGDGGESAASARPASARTPSGMGGRNMSNRPSAANPTFQMGTFGAPARAGPNQLPPNTTSEQRFAMSNARNPIPNPFAFGRPPGVPMSAQMSRNASNNALSAIPNSPRMGGPSRGGSRAESKRNKQSSKQIAEENNKMPLTAGMDLSAIQVSATGWKPRSVGTGMASGPALGGEGHLAPDVVQRKVKANLNKMTPEKFDKISDQILDIAAQSKDETDGRTLRQVIQLTFEKATDEAHWAPMYAMFCKRMLESMSPDIKDENIKDKNGNIVTGGNLFRKYLLNRCQEEFERGWKVNLPNQGDEAVILSDEYYIAAAAKRRGLGLVKFIGELFKLGMLTERIMHECVKKLLDYEGIPDEAEVESLTSLLRTVGSNLDKSDSKAQPRMSLYFERITAIMKMPELPSRLQFMLLDIIDLRKNNWHSKEDNKGPKTLQEIHEEAQEAQRKAEMARLASQSNRGGGGRMPMGRGDPRNFSASGYGQMPPPDNSSRVGTDDLRRLGAPRPSRTASNMAGSTFGPTSMSGPRNNSRRGLGPGASLLAPRGEDSGNSSRTGTPPAQKEVKKDEASTNAFSALAALEGHEGPASPPSNHSSPPTQKSQPNIERERSRSPEKSKE